MSRWIIILILLFVSFGWMGSQTEYEPVDITPSISKEILKQEEVYLKTLDSLRSSYGDPLALLKVQLNLANFYALRRGFFSKADSLVAYIRDQPELEDHPSLKSHALTIKGLVDYGKRDYKAAITAHHEAILIKEKNGQDNLSYDYLRIGVNLLGLSNYQEALQHFLKVEKLLLAKDDFNPKLSQRIGSAYMNLNNPSASERYYKLSIQQAKQKKRSLIQGTSMDRLATLYLQQGRHEESIALTKESLVLRKGKMHQVHKIGACINLASNYLALQKYQLAREYAVKALEIARGIKSPGATQQGLRLLVDIDLAEGKKDLTIQHYQELLAARDTFYNLENARTFNELYHQLDLASKERELLKKEIIIEQQARSKNRLYFLISILSLLGVLGAFLYLNKVRYQKDITAKNKIIQKSLAEKETLLKEIHHRVKNNLQVVSSLLGLQSLSISDAKAKEAISSGRGRVHSMSLIHQSLYKKDNLTGIEMRPYAQKLVTSLIQTYQVHKQKITFSNQVEDDLILDAESVVPIGLILNELITNALKYAFDDRQEGCITIKMEERENVLHLQVSDDGVGMDLNQRNEDSFGFKLIRAFQSKLHADLNISVDQGVTITLEIKEYKRVG